MEKIAFTNHHSMIFTLETNIEELIFHSSTVEMLF